MPGIGLAAVGALRNPRAFAVDLEDFEGEK
jgi:hypothetical protein